MSSPKYQGRHHAGRHRASGDRVRLPRVFSSKLALPTSLAAALLVTATGTTVVTATGATVVESAPTTLGVSGQQTAIARTEQASEGTTSTDITRRRQASGLDTAALQGRVEAQQRAARTAKRKAAEAAAAQAKAKAAAAKAAAAQVKAERGGKRWVEAMRSGRMTSGFGPRWGRNHNGLDIAAPNGTPLYAMSKGTVIKAGFFPTSGNKVEIRYWDGTVSKYLHMSRIDVRKGQTVMPGDIVGAVGNTGRSFGAHLHIEIHPTGGNNPVNPLPWLKAKGIFVG